MARVHEETRIAIGKNLLLLESRKKSRSKIPTTLGESVTHSISDLKVRIKEENDPIKKVLLIQKRLDLETKEAEARKEEEQRQEEESRASMTTNFFVLRAKEEMAEGTNLILEIIKNFAEEKMEVDTKPLYSISKASHWTGIDKSVLRDYDRYKLIHPARTSAKKQANRLYSDRDLDTASLVFGLTTQHNMKLADIRVIFELAGVLEDLMRDPQLQG